MRTRSKTHPYQLRKRKRFCYSIEGPLNSELRYILDPEEPSESDSYELSNTSEEYEETDPCYILDELLAPEESSSDGELDPLIQHITATIKKKCPSLDIPDDKFNKFAKKVIKTAASKEIDLPSEDEEDTLDDVDKAQLTCIREHIKDNAPTLSKIINAPISLEQKAKTLQLYDVMDQTMAGTEDHLSVYNTINHRLPPKDALTDEERSALENIRHIMEREKITLSKILGAKLPPSIKKEVLRLHDIARAIDPYSQRSLDAEKDLKAAFANERYFLRSGDDPDEFDKTKKYYEEQTSLSDVELQAKIFKLDASNETKLRIYEMFAKMNMHCPNSSEYSSLRSKLVWAVNLPHQRLKIDHLDGLTPGEYCDQVRRRLDEKLYGLKEVKEHIVQMVNNRLYNPHAKTMLGLCGEPGLGKTEIAQSLAYALDLPFERISLGGMIDAGIFRGSDGVWVGSTPSIIIQILKRMTYANGVILFDELDKLTTDQGKQVQFALLHITDYTQNKDFQDLYLNEFPHDLSNLWYMFAMNDDQTLDKALKDRLKIVKVKRYSGSEKTVIVQKYLLPKYLKQLGMPPDSCTITRAACSTLIDKVNSTSVRPLSQALHEALSKINLLRTRLEHGSEYKLTYSLPRFEGFPYEIQSWDIVELCQNIEEKFSYFV